MGRATPTWAAPLWAILLGALLLAGCSVFSGKADYRDYRTLQRADTERQRMIAMRDYLENHPDGQWSEEVRNERQRVEPALFEASKSTAGGLRWYLEAYPNGRFAEQAQARLAALESVRTNRQGEADDARQVRAERREAAQLQRRQWGTQAVTYWSRILLAVENWGRPIGEVAAGDAEFNEAFAANPRPRCSQTECIKFYQLDFAIPIPGRTRLEQSLRILLRLRLDEERNLTRAEMLMPDRGFSRWYELENETPVMDADPEQRQQIITWALEHIVPIIRELAPTAQGIDVVPEPIDPPTVRAPNQPDPGASAIPGVDTGDGPASSESESDGGGDVPADFASETLVLPLALQGLRVDDLRIVVFAAADDDEGPAYDGIFLELVEEE